jgi:NADP-dependent 3-hydroxy acid dehydrogenase YdfG/acyl carrier protein
MSQWSVWRCFFNGGRIGFSTASERLFDDMRGIGPTIVFAPPAIWSPIASSYHAEVDATKTMSIEASKVEVTKIKAYYRGIVGTRAKSISVGSAKVSESLMDFLREVFGAECKVYDGYGTTEFGHLLKDGRVCQKNAEIKLLDVPDLGYSTADKPHPRGELLVRSKLMVPEYANDVEESAKAWDKDGWYHTGDVVEWQDGDKLCFIDRLKNFFKLGDGTFASAANIEAVLQHCPSVSQIFVLAVPQLVATVVPIPAVIDRIKSGSVDESIVKEAFLNEFKRYGRQKGLDENLIPLHVVVELEEWNSENGFLGLSLKPVRPALTRFYEPLMVKASGDIETIRKSVLLSTVVFPPRPHPLGTVLVALREEVKKVSSLVTENLFAAHHLRTSLRSHDSLRAHLRVTVVGADVNVDSYASQHDPPGILCSCSLGVHENCVDVCPELKEIYSSVSPCEPGDLSGLQEFMTSQNGELSLHSSHRNASSILISVLGRGPCREQLYIDASILLAHALGHSQRMILISIGQLLMYRRLQDIDQVYICAFKNATSGTVSCAVFNHDGDRILLCSDLSFLPESQESDRLLMAGDSCYEFPWEATSDVSSLAQATRFITVVIGKGPKSKALGEALCVYLGRRFCFITEELPEKVDRDVMILSFLDDMDIIDGLELGLFYVKAMANCGKICWIVTVGTQEPTATHPKHGGLWGMARSARAEYSESIFAMLDVSDSLGNDDLAVALAKETQLLEVAPELVLTEMQRLRPSVRRLAFTDMSPTALKSDGIYIISGGTGSLGLLSARRMVEMGARNIVLLSRTIRAREDSMDAWDWLQNCPAQVVVRSCDVTSEEECFNTLLSVKNELKGPILGVVHAAGRADAAPLMKYSGELLRRTVSAKVLGAWNLHKATVALKLDLQFFVMYSSVSALLNSAAAGAVGYAAANAMLDTLSHFRHTQGLPATSIAWGAWSQAGLAARHDGVIGMLTRSGIHPINSEKGLAAFEHLLSSANSHIMVAPMDWSTFSSMTTALHAPFLRFNSALDGRPVTVGRTGATTSSRELREWFVSTLKLIFDNDLPSDFLMSPWPALGLDSMSSVYLLQMIARDWSITLNLDFFEQHSSPEKALEYLQVVCKENCVSDSENNHVAPSGELVTTKSAERMSEALYKEWFDRQLTMIFGEVLPGDYSTSWVNLGMDSMMSVHLLQIISRDLHITTNLDFLTEFETPTKVFEELMSRTNAVVQSVYSDKSPEPKMSYGVGVPPQAIDNVSFSVNWVQESTFRYGVATWDSEPFGFPSYVFDIPDVANLGYAELFTVMSRIGEGVEGPVHAYVRIPMRDLPNTRVLQANGFYALETSCVVRRSLDDLHDVSTFLFDSDGNFDFHEAEEGEIENVLELIDPIFWNGPGRHFLDDNIPKEGATERYRNWIKNGLVNKNILTVTSERAKGRILAFMLVAGEGTHADLSLFGCDPRHSPRGLGVCHLQKLLPFLRNLGFTTTSAQISLFDPGVPKLYEGCGFTVDLQSFSTVFHWRKS